MMDTIERLKNTVQAILAVAILGGSFVLFYVLLFKGVEGSSKDIILFVLGVVSTIDTQIISFYFGSSKESADKNSVISNLSQQDKYQVGGIK